jgi:ubiquitin carboxyl-terminal hydrolase 7
MRDYMWHAVHANYMLVPLSEHIMDTISPASDMAMDVDESVEEIVADSDDKVPVILATDHDAMRELVFQPLPDNPKILDDVVDTWKISGWRSMSKKEHGPVFHAHGIPWRILLFPHGNNIDQASIYLEHGAHVDDVDEDFSCCVHFAIVMWNPKDPTIHFQHTATHRFTRDEADWGFTRFLELRKMFNVALDGATRPICEDDEVNISAYVRVVDDETGVMWHNWTNYDSKKQTGYVGLKNQGATCYLNSLLQSLYFTNAFRKAIYDIPTEDEADMYNSAYMLQRLFYQLQTSSSSVGTNELTKSFGWETRHVFEQQDVQELSRKLMERMEEKMKGTAAEKVLPEMFSGKIKTYISCINVNYESSRIEDFWDIQLNVRGLDNLEASFRDYIQVERMDGENQYFAGDDHKLQDAKKGVIFLSFPDVLHLQLKRFEYDIARDMMTKINDRYEFPESFDAAPYLSEDADRSESWEYQLHSVLIHQGDLTAGHYYAYIKPEKEGWFYRFDDELAHKATMNRICEDGFGGVWKSPTANNKLPRKAPTMRPNSAYMLVYIRKSRLDRVLPPVTEDDIPKHLTFKFEEEQRIRDERRKERDEAHLYVTAKVVTPHTFKAHDGIELATWDASPDVSPAAPRTYRLLKHIKFSDFVEHVATDLGVERRHVRLWTMVHRQNKTIRPEVPFLDLDLPVEVAFLRSTAVRDNIARLWAEVAPLADENQKPIWSPPHPGVANMAPSVKPIVLFLKYFDLDTQKVHGVGHLYADPDKKVEDLFPVMREMLGWDSGSDDKLVVYEEIKPSMIERLKPKQTLRAAELQDGDIVCCQRPPPEPKAAEKDANALGNRFDSIRDHFDFMVNAVTVDFQPHPSRCPEGRYTSFKVELNPHRVGYDTVAERVGSQLSVPPTHLRFWTLNATTGNPKVTIKRNPTSPPLLSTMLGLHTQHHLSVGTPRPDYILFFEVLDINLAELEQSKNVKVVWLSEGITKETTVDLFVPKQGTIDDLTGALVRKLAIPDVTEGGPIRVFEASQCKFFRELSPQWPVVNINEYSTMYAERIPTDEVEAPANEFIHCFSFSTDPSRPHGVPFRLLLKDEEPFSETKKRIEQRTGLKGKLFEKIRFCIVRRSAFSKPQYLVDDDRLWNLTSPNGDEWLCLERPDRSRATRNGVGDLFLK